MAEDGSYSTVETLQYGMDQSTQSYSPVVNSARGIYDVTVKQGESYKSKKDADRQSAVDILQYASTETPIGQMALLSAVQSTTGEGSEAMRKIARMEEIQILVSKSLMFLMAGYPIEKLGITDPEEMQMAMMIAQQMAQQAQNQQNPQEILAQAEGQARIMEGQAALENEKNDADKNQIEWAKVQQKGQEIQIKAAEAGVKIDKTVAETGKILSETEGAQINNIQSVFGNQSQ